MILEVMMSKDKEIQKIVRETANDDWWGEHPDWTREEWRLEIAERNTQLGYWDWVFHLIEANDEDH